MIYIGTEIRIELETFFCIINKTNKLTRKYL